MSTKDKRKRERLLARREAAVNRATAKRRKREWKAEQRAERDEIVARALQKHQTVEQKFALAPLDQGIKEAVLRRARKLVDERFKEGLLFLSRESGNWVRDIADWKPKGKSPGSQFRSLVKHLLVKYTMPDFMYSVFFEEVHDVQQKGLDLFKRLGAGASLYKLVKAGDFPVPLTKRMCHVFMQSTVRLSFLEAVRHAQVLVYGGDRRVAEALCTTGQLGHGFKAAEEFWATVIQWTCNQPMLAPAQFGPIYDWVARARTTTTRHSR